MRINPSQLSPPLRLVRPPDSAPPPAQLASARHAGDRYRPDSLHIAEPSTVNPADTYRRLARIRRSLVAGRTDAPIHFQPPTPPAPANPYAITYRSAAPDPTEQNAAAARAADLPRE